MKLIDKIKGLFKKEGNDVPPRRYLIYVYKNGDLDKRFPSDKQDIKTLSYLLLSFSHADDYEILYDIDALKVYVNFITKKGTTFNGDKGDAQIKKGRKKG